jgi:hypothetical protein
MLYCKQTKKKTKKKKNFYSIYQFQMYNANYKIKMYLKQRCVFLCVGIE